MKLNIIASLFCISTLSACCGNDCSGEDNHAEPYTKLDVVETVTLAALATTMTHDHVGYLAYYMALVAQGFSSFNSGNKSFPSAPCDSAVGDSGNFSIEISKKTTRTGFSSGDSITYIFSKCKYNGTLVDGKFKLTALQEIVDLKEDAFAVRYQADLTGFSLSDSGITTRMHGTVNVNFSANIAPPEAIDFDFSVPAGQTMTAAVTTSKGDFVMAYGGGTTFAARGTKSPNTASRKLDGPVNVQTKAAGAVPLQISTPVALTGTDTGLVDSFVPTSGTMQVKSSDLTTSTTISGVMAKVSADSDRNGSLDLVFDSNWTELTTR